MYVRTEFSHLPFIHCALRKNLNEALFLFFFRDCNLLQHGRSLAFIAKGPNSELNMGKGKVEDGKKCALMHFLDCGGNELPDKKSLLSIAKKNPRSTFLRFPERLSFLKSFSP